MNAPRMDDDVTLLVIDDDLLIPTLIETALSRPGLRILKEQDAVRAVEVVRVEHPDIVILDLVMPNVAGMELLEQIVESGPGTEVVLLTGHYSAESAVEAIRRGACDYLTKPFDLALLRARIGELVAAAQNRRRAEKLEEQLLETSQFAGMVGGSPAILEVFSTLRRIAPHYRTALLIGETGTGKQLAAEVLQRLSPVSDRPFVVCNCAAIVETLFETELFGHVRGAFTGAFQDRTGVFEAADGGTLFLDEIGDIPLPVQSKLLRAVQQQEIQRVGAAKARKVDVRVIAATNRDLRAMVQDKQFREDLYYRLAMVEIRLPPLSERKEDLPLLEKHFVESFSKQYKKPVHGLTRRAQTVLSRHSWPGNVRELENVIGRACMMTSGDTIDVRDLPEYLRTPSLTGTIASSGLLTLAEVERRHVEYVLGQVGGNKLEAAAILGIARATLYRILNREMEAQAAQG